MGRNRLGGERSDSPRKRWGPGSTKCGLDDRALQTGRAPPETHGPGNEPATNTKREAIATCAISANGTQITIIVQIGQIFSQARYIRTREA
ncbi:hypothetical protein GCM10023193_22240 [Planotetraspora kaengkrachanensis]|uniref:Uncharacterized protein n=1 Tax=Planotetraspora kaengkrachanensis TaxID=575193 RepID=A0A8J3M5Y0_9ACTN|nr:hypothetical protein Pka01_31910 [Planotetraspora kaengkrachanensis]